ncbi:BIG1-domain-containing protein [Hypoxylon trugodes]|uniref:BIG1-domain-containing protein n=1 Tax=Hypoxylon trugodes TaxID=326681 RepID=UPI00219E9ACA|nr:BIG1-domain-containing protein [Hypoxylon trugodes]KAI1391167.1 BIG1-domain-containing protein [Hypoxylon trugodes]
MRLFQAAAALAACSASAHAFSDSSPFIMFSSAGVPTPSRRHQIQSIPEVQLSMQQFLGSCPTDRYLVVSQPNLNAGDLSAKDAVPNLRRSLDKAHVSHTIAEVAGQLDTKDITRYIQKACEGTTEPFIDELELAPLPSSDSVRTLKENDDELGMALEQYEREGSYTVIYAGGQRKETPKAYKAEFTGAVHTELKRQLHSNQQRANQSRNLPLFEKYQYFTPGIFTGLIAFVVLMSILYAGISAVASLEVPYGAFDKEMGPSAQKKQQ